MSPRKSSTSSGRASRPRARYLGIEVAGEPFPNLSPARWVASLQDALAGSGHPEIAFRLVRTDRARAIVRVRHRDLSLARRAWNGARGAFRTTRTWGTLLGAKAWIGSRSPRADEPPPAPNRSRDLR